MVTTIIYYQQQHNLLSFVGSLFVRILFSFKHSLPPTILHPPEMMFMIMTMMGEREGSDLQFILCSRCAISRARCLTHII